MSTKEELDSCQSSMCVYLIPPSIAVSPSCFVPLVCVVSNKNKFQPRPLIEWIFLIFSSISRVSLWSLFVYVWPVARQNSTNNQNLSVWSVSVWPSSLNSSGQDGGRVQSSFAPRPVRIRAGSFDWFWSQISVPAHSNWIHLVEMFPSLWFQFSTSNWFDRSIRINSFSINDQNTCTAFDLISSSPRWVIKAIICL